MTCARTVSRFSLSMLARCGGREDVAVHRDNGLGRQCLRPLNVTYASGQPPVLEDDTRIEAFSLATDPCLCHFDRRLSRSVLLRPQQIPGVILEHAAFRALQLEPAARCAPERTHALSRTGPAPSPQRSTTTRAPSEALPRKAR